MVTMSFLIKNREQRKRGDWRFVKAGYETLP